MHSDDPAYEIGGGGVNDDSATMSYIRKFGQQSETKNSKTDITNHALSNVKLVHHSVTQSDAEGEEKSTSRIGNHQTGPIILN